MPSNTDCQANTFLHFSFHFPKREQPCYLDGPIVLKSGQRLTADAGAEIRLNPGTNSKFFVHRIRRGYYVIVSNSNPHRRDPLTLAIRQDGVVFTKLFWLIGGRHVDYPHIIEHDGHLLIAFSGARQTMEVMKVSLDERERLAMPESVELDPHLPPVKKTPSNRRDRRTGSTLGTKGRRFTPPRIWSFLNSATDSAGFTNVRMAPTREALAKVSIIYERVEDIGPDLQAPLHAESLK